MGLTTPIITGFACLGIAAFAVILWTEKGKLFEPHQPDRVVVTERGNDNTRVYALALLRAPMA